MDTSTKNVSKGVKYGCVVTPILFGLMFSATLTDVFCYGARPGVEVLGIGELEDSCKLWVMHLYSYSIYSDFTNTLRVLSQHML